jgi:nitrate/TMAO reductase-like tetraheme cytochrome c subunit
MQRATTPPGDRHRLQPVVYNLTTFLGGALAGLSLSLIALLVTLEVLAEQKHPYMGIITFLILPAFLLTGVALMIVGVLRQVRLRHRGIGTPPLPRLDLNDPRHRRAMLLASVGTVLLAALSAFGSFQAYEYTESNTFCGELCHSVMHPEFSAYEQSPHARVRCVDCHIGSGATWFVRSKLSGVYQLYAVLFDRFPRPIPTPIESLRPSRDTCEQCHWPSYFYSEKLTVHDYYLSDEANTQVRLGVLMKTGGGAPGSGHASGIHWHMSIENEVYYFAADEARQRIPWVRVRGPDGTERTYVDAAADVPAEEIVEAQLRRMDCLDCHNRPTHNFHPPNDRLNRLLRSGRIDPSLPSIKAASVEALEQPWQTLEEAADGIASRLRGFYAERHPELYEQRRSAIETAIAQVQDVYRGNYFPAMKVSWRAFPDHVGHLYAPGCFRCHDGNHVSEDGSVLARDCELCHTLDVSDGGYAHPVDIGEVWKDTNCSDCHGS